MIFIDASAWIAYLLARDQYHPVAVAAWQQLPTQKPILTSNFVLDETFTYVARRAGHSFVVAQAQRIYASPAVRILRPTENDELAAMALFAKFADQGVSFTDCTSFVLMRANRVKKVFGFDRHFEIAGFTLWPGAD
jgi:predicted nucleic acid-binding protein